MSRTTHESNPSVLEYFANVYRQGKSIAYSSALSASLFSSLTFLEASKQLERAARNLKISDAESETVLCDLERKLKLLMKEKVTLTSLQSLELLLSTSRQLEAVTNELEAFTDGEERSLKYTSEVSSESLRNKLNDKYKDVASFLYRVAVLSSHWSLEELLQFSRKLESVTGDVEMLAHKIADPSFESEQKLQILYLGELLSFASNAVLQKLVQLQGELASKISAKYENSGLKLLLLTTAQRNVSKLAEASKFVQHVTEELELSAHVLADQHFKPDTEPCLNSTVAHGQEFLYNRTIASLLGLVSYLHGASKQLENVTTSLDKQISLNKRVQKPDIASLKQAAVQYVLDEYKTLDSSVRRKIGSASHEGIEKVSHAFTELQKFAGELKPRALDLKETPIAAFVSAESNRTRGFTKEMAYSLALNATNLLLNTSKRLEMVTEEIGLFTEEIYGSQSEKKNRSKLLHACSRARKVLNETAEVVTKKALVPPTLWTVLLAHNILQRLEKVTTTTEAAAAKMREPGFEREIFEQTLHRLSNIKKTSYQKALLTCLSAVANLEAASKSLQAFTTDLEALVSRKIKKSVDYKKTPGHRNRKRDNNCNHANDKTGGAYKMMSDSKELERLLNELETFVSETAEAPRRKASRLSKWKQDAVGATRTSSMIALQSAALISAKALLGASRSLENVTGSLEIAAEKFSKTDISQVAWRAFKQNKQDLYNKTLSLALWNVNRLKDASKISQYVTSDLELFSHEVCYPSVPRKETSFCSKALDCVDVTQKSIGAKSRRLALSSALFGVSGSLFALRKLEDAARGSRSISELLYWKSVDFALKEVQVLLVASEELKSAIAGFECRLNQPKITLSVEKQKSPSRLFVSSAYDYGRDKIIAVSARCVAELAQIVKLLESYARIFEESAKYEPLDVTVWDEINRIGLGIAKNSHYTIYSPYFTFEFEMHFSVFLKCQKRDVRSIEN